jgi:type IV pilus assembly protein PilA
MRNGFTLIELMIVVAIIGILAAIAIPGFQKYIHNSKTSEAKVSLDSIKKGALTYFQAEHYSDDGMSSMARIYPEAESVTGIGTAASHMTIGVKFSPESAVDILKTEPWTDLNFSMNSPFYFYYIYDSTNETSPSFQASASASLDDDCDAIFVIEGTSDGSSTAVMDMSGDASKCNIAVAP